MPFTPKTKQEAPPAAKKDADPKKAPDNGKKKQRRGNISRLLRERMG